jgi:hypothetical protein
MASYGQSVTVFYYAWNTASTAGQTADAANHTLYLVKDGGTPAVPTNSPAECSTAELPGWYQLVLTAAEASHNTVLLGGVSATTSVVLCGSIMTFEQLPTAAPAASGGLLTFGTGTGQVNPNGSGLVPATLAASNVTGNVPANLVTIATQTVTCGAGVTVNPQVGCAYEVSADSSGRVLLQPTQTGVTIPTVTTVTNQLTAAQIATGVWQDATAGDFTTASSVGKSLYNAFTAGTSVFTTAALANGPGGGASAGAIATAVWQDLLASSDFSTASSVGALLKTAIPSAAAGASGGLFIAGSNAGTTVNLTGNLSGSVGSVTGAVGSVTGAVTISTGQTLAAARALDSIADTSLTVNDALHCAIAGAAGKESITGTSYVIQTPDTATTLRTFTLNSSTTPTSRS